MVSQHYFTFLSYIPAIYQQWSNWHEYLLNYLLRRHKPAEYRMRNGGRLIDATGTLAGTIAVVFVRREYGTFEGLKTIVDIGANMGTFSVFAAQACPEANIYCFEPEPKNFDVLNRNIQANGLERRVRAYPWAVAAVGGPRDLAIGESPLNSFHMSMGGPSRRHEVQCTTLSEIFSTHQLEVVDLLKMNCEGAEYEILETCPSEQFATIERIRLEYHNLDETNRNGEFLAELLRSKGYTIERFTRYKGVSGFIWGARQSISERGHSSPLMRPDTQV